MAELAYTGLPYTTYQNRRTPRTIYHIDADGFKGNFSKVVSGEALADECITTRMINPILWAKIQGRTTLLDRDPDADDDESDTNETGIIQEVGFLWLNTTSNVLFICKDPTEETAVWQAIGGGGGATDFTDLEDVPSSYVGQGGKVVAVKADVSGLEFISPPSGGAKYLTFTLRGNLYVATTINFVLIGFTGTLTDAGAYCLTAPTGAGILVDVNKNGTSMFSTRLEIDAGSNTDDGNRVFDTTEVFDVPKNKVLDGDRVSIDIDQVGSTVTGADISIYLKFE